jgi:hypothetical protein
MDIPKLKNVSAADILATPIRTDGCMLPPPKYKEAKGTSKVIKRVKSRGESSGGRTAESSPKKQKSRHVNARYTKRSRLHRG